MAERLVTIGTYHHIETAHLDCMRLESEGIECFIANDYSPYGGIFRSIRLEVKELDAERAAAILEQRQKGDLPDASDLEDRSEA